MVERLNYLTQLSKIVGNGASDNATSTYDNPFICHFLSPFQESCYSLIFRKLMSTTKMCDSLPSLDQWLSEKYCK